MLVETARLWLSLGHHDRHGIWHLDGVTGPDEYTAVVRDNVFTNLMAAHNLRTAAEACARHPEAAHAMGVSTEETAAWRDAADAAHIPYDEELGVHPQCEGFTTLREWDFAANTLYPLLLHEPYVRLYPAQVVKQADLVLAMQWQSHAFTPEQKARNVDYYERRTTRDSSLSACTQAVMCAEVGHLELAHDYTYEAALIDLRDLHHNTRDGLHMASLAGAWTALVAGFGGLRDDEGVLALDPHLPDGISRLRFRLRWKGFRLTVDVDHDEVTYTLRDGPGRWADDPPRRRGTRAHARRADDRCGATPQADASTPAAASGPRTATAPTDLTQSDLDAGADDHRPGQGQAEVRGGVGGDVRRRDEQPLAPRRHRGCIARGTVRAWTGSRTRCRGRAGLRSGRGRAAKERAARRPFHVSETALTWMIPSLA